MSFIIRAYRPGDEEEILDMFNEVFGQNRDIAHWHWKYRDDPYGSYCISLAVAPDGVLAAHFAGYPVKLYSAVSPQGPADIDTLQLGDKMTRREFRSVGFGKSALIAKTYAHFKEAYVRENIPFTYGFAAHHSLRFGVSVLKYADLEPVPYRRLDFGVLGNMRIRGFTRLFSTIRTEEAETADETWTDFFYRVAPRYEYLTRRDETYVRWRYFGRPDRRYLVISARKRGRLSGWSVFHRENNKIVWGDALCDPGDPDCIKAILIRLRRHPLSEGADFVECWFPPRPLWWDRVLREIGFRISEEPNGLHFVSPAFNDRSALQTLGERFYYTLGDSDLF